MTVQYGTTALTFEVQFKDRKTMEIAITPPDKIVVTAPTGTPEEVIHTRVKQKASWLIQKMFTFRNMQTQKIRREFVNGESFMYLGRNYTMQIQVDDKNKHPQVKLFRGKFYVTVPIKDEELIKVAMEGWYRNKAQEQIQQRIHYYQAYLDKQPTGIQIKDQKKRWGSCTGNDELLFNWRCIMAKAPALDYIIVHELCHMYHKDHSKAFWELLAKIMPDYEVRRGWLKDYGVNLDL